VGETVHLSGKCDKQKMVGGAERSGNPKMEERA
jgi:hypothetical protein